MTGRGEPNIKDTMVMVCMATFLAYVILAVGAITVASIIAIPFAVIKMLIVSFI